MTKFNELVDGRNAQDTQKKISEYFIEKGAQIPEFVRLRKLVEKEVFGFGEFEFYYMHKMILDSLKGKVTFCEIGVYKGQILALYRLMANLFNRDITTIGITPLDSTDGHIEADYLRDIHLLHDTFDLVYPIILKYNSTDPEMMDMAKNNFLLDILYIDGGHTKEVVTSDIINYAPLVRSGGYLIIDDSANNMEGVYSGRFWGIQAVSNVVDSILPPKTENAEWEYIGNVIHNRVWKRR